MFRKFILIAIVFAALGKTGWADDLLAQVGGKILQVGMDARGLGMGEAQTALAEKFQAMFWNPAGLGGASEPELAYAHTLWLGDIQLGSVGYAQPLLQGGLGLEVRYSLYGQFQKIDVDPSGNPLPRNSTYSPYDLVVGVGYGQTVLPGVEVGGTLHYLSEVIENFSSQTAALDLGCQWRKVAGNLNLGITLHNLGLPLQGYHLPFFASVGAAYALPFLIDANQDQFLAAVDGQVPFPWGLPAYGSLGVEYRYTKMFFGRLGYKVGEVNQLGEFSGFTAGIGLRYQEFQLDYAFVPMGTLGASHRLSLTAGLGNLLKAPEPSRPAEREKAEIGEVSEPESLPEKSAGPEHKPREIQPLADRNSGFEAEESPAISLASLGLHAAVTGDKKQAKLAEVLFEEGSAELTPTALEMLKAHAQTIKGRVYAELVIEGYADLAGEAAAAFPLSQKRANQVARYLIASYSLSPQNIVIRGRGNKNFVSDGTSAGEQAKNRRVEITIVYQK